MRLSGHQRRLLLQHDDAADVTAADDSDDDTADDTADDDTAADAADHDDDNDATDNCGEIRESARRASRVGKAS